MTTNSSVTEIQDTSLATAPLLSLFWRYTIPTITAMVISGIYVTIDGIFVGHFLGEQGLAGVMLAYPVGSVLYAVGAMIGMGASSLVSLNMGRGDLQSARGIVGNALLLVIFAALIIGSVGLLYGGHMLRWLGAEGEIYSAGMEYLRWYFMLGSAALLSMSFSALLRNDGQPKRVTYIMVLGGTLNVIMDYLFLAVFPMGLAGVGLATMLSQVVTGGLCLSHFCSRRSQLRLTWVALRPKLTLLLQILRLGTSSLLMYLYLSVVLAFHNKAFMSVGSALHVAAYGIVSYAEAFFYLIFEGIALGIQPITSFNAGAGLEERVRKIRNLGLGITAGLGISGMIALYLFPQYVAFMFAGDNPGLTKEAVNGIYRYFWGLPMEGLLLVGATYFQSVNKPVIASTLTGGKLLLIGGFLFVFARWWGVNGVWMALPACSTLLCIWMLWQMKNENRHPARGMLE